VPLVVSPFAELLAGLAGALRSLGCRWYLFGAQAAILHGAERLTNDIDVTVDLGEVSLKSLLRALRASGFVLRVKNPQKFVESTRVLPARHRGSGIDVDIVLAGPGPEQLFLERAVRRRIEGVWIPVASVEDVVAMKVLSGRPKDAEDVKEIVAAQGPRLDVGRVRATLESFEDALDRSDLLVAFETLAKAVGKRRSHAVRGTSPRRRR